jgi:hypothetical protein
MSDSQSIRVNFSRPMPVFPLASVTLMPHAVLPVHIFEPRYRAMIDSALDGPGQIAMGVFAGEMPGARSAGDDAAAEGGAAPWQDAYDRQTDDPPPPALRPAVCVGQIVQHQKLDDGRYNIALQGVCRARIDRELAHAQTGTPYRQAMLVPVGIDTNEDEQTAAERAELTLMLTQTTLHDLREAPAILKHLADEDVPTSAILELLTFTMLPDPELRYRLLAEGDLHARASIIRGELAKLQTLLSRAAPQRREKPPKGVNWN